LLISMVSPAARGRVANPGYIAALYIVVLGM